MKSKSHLKQYTDYVEHPRYGKGPRLTDLDPEGEPAHSHLCFPSDKDSWAIPGTAVEADLERQVPSTVPAPRYYDIDTSCRDCRRRFIFFAEEQKYWYEELKFYIYAGPVRCPTCRKHLQHLARVRRRYEELFHVSAPSRDETLEMIDGCLTLIEEGIFSIRQTEHVRMLMNRITEENRAGERMEGLIARLHAVESQPPS